MSHELTQVPRMIQRDLAEYPSSHVDPPNDSKDLAEDRHAAWAAPCQCPNCHGHHGSNWVGHPHPHTTTVAIPSTHLHITVVSAVLDPLQHAAKINESWKIFQTVGGNHFLHWSQTKFTDSRDVV
jgi:hypothetical protein